MGHNPFLKAWLGRRTGPGAGKQASGKSAVEHPGKIENIVWHEVFGGGPHISRCGWTTEIGPGRHPISSAYFWYVKNPAGALAEYYANEDMLTGAWQPREFAPSPEAFAEWAVIGGIDGNTRRQAPGPSAEPAAAGRAAKP